MTTTNETMWAIQSMTDARDEAEAVAIMATLREQVGFLGGRILPASVGYLSGTKVLLGRSTWAVQAIFEDAPEAGWLPDGLRRVIVLPSQRQAFGIA